MKTIKLLTILSFTFIFLLDIKSIYAANIEEDDYVNSFSLFNQTKQIVVVTGDHINSTKGNLVLYENLDGTWVKTIENVGVVFGKNGLSKEKAEGDGRTPIGLFGLESSFGTEAKPSDVELPYTKVTSHYFWIDDVQSSDYNKMVHYTGNPVVRWNSYEQLNHPLYQYVIVVDYNMNPIIPGKGSAIFLHSWRSDTSPTLGCIAMSQPHLLLLMAKLDPTKKPVVVTSLENEVNETISANVTKINELMVLVNHNKLFTDQAPVLHNSRTLLPLRGLFEYLGADVDYIPSNKSVSINKDNIKIRLTIGSKKTSINGVEHFLDVEPIIMNNRTLIPVRFVSEALGARVDYNGDLKRVYIEVK
ncbi:stalk domain-containing protein [Bacillus pinisoli]|uniref:stalk domain-containing protein n=1 Tax=Bacillus pinisoli TaxID=2901866 RepID=UPI001FF44FA1|nr:stalk domain-containing protein [Bacillus pinisoli]